MADLLFQNVSIVLREWLFLHLCSWDKEKILMNRYLRPLEETTQSVAMATALDVAPHKEVNLTRGD